MRHTSRLSTRRQMLRGLVNGAAVTVALPFLDCFLDANGGALAATGAPLPTRFGTWFWGCGLRPGTWEPAKIGRGYEMTSHLAALKPFESKMSIISGLSLNLDGNPLRVHWSGARACSAGEVLDNAPSIDTIVSDYIGTKNRFRSIEVSAPPTKGASAQATNSLSRRNATLINPPESSPVNLYLRLFGPGFVNPNAEEFKPDPATLLQKSVLSSIKEPRTALMKEVGSADRRRLDEYFTSLRQIENQISLQLQAPPRMEGFSMPKKPSDRVLTSEVSDVGKQHELLAQLLAQALASNQTKVVNVWFTGGELHHSGEPRGHHTLTHEEPVVAGEQQKVAWYEQRIMENFATFLRVLDGIREGDGTLLDHSLIYAHSECGLARTHAVENLPIFLAGGASGRVKPGWHLHQTGVSVTSAGLTALQAMRVPVGRWGTGSMQTERAFTEMLA